MGREGFKRITPAPEIREQGNKSEELMDGRFHRYPLDRGYLYPSDLKELAPANDVSGELTESIETLQEEDESRPHIDISRRSFLGASAALTAGVGIAELALHKNRGAPAREDPVQGSPAHESSSDQGETHEDGKRAALAEQIHRLRERTIDISAYSAEHIGVRGAQYLGIERMPKKDAHGIVHNKDGSIAYEPLPKLLEHVRFDTNIARLWKEKNERYKNKQNEQLGAQLVDSYGTILQRGEEKRMTLTTAIASSERDVTATRNAIDWRKVSVLYKFDTDKKKAELCSTVLEKLAHHIDGRILTSISMTEIMTLGENYDTNADMYDLLLQTAGMDFVTRIPALSDAQPSFGKYQHTPYAMNIIETHPLFGKPKKNYVGASQMNRAVREDHQIPEQIQTPENYHLFTSDAHQNTFAFLFALHNIAETIDTLYRLDPKLVEEFAHIDTQTLMEFIATSHHKPHPSTDAIIPLLRHLKKGRADSYISECPKDLHVYGVRTVKNHEALERYV